MVSYRVSSKPSLKSFGLLALTAFSLLFSNTAGADPACDATFMTAMKQKAWMEAQREIMIAEAIIAKPDSVFTLGCFNNFYNSFTGSVSFTNGSTYATSTVGSNIDTFLNAALNLNAAFSTLGGGHYTGSNGRGANCNTMMNLWNRARCWNAADNNPANIYTLTDISSYNRGAFPQACPDNGNWTTPLQTFSTKVASQSVLAAFDDMNLFLDVTAPVNQTTSRRCSAGLPTGVTFAVSSGTRDEVVCPNPGCTPDTTDPTPKCCVMTFGADGAPSTSQCSS